MPPENVPVHVECSIMRNVKASSTKAELGRLCENFQKATYKRTALAEMVPPQPPILVATKNTVTNSLFNGMLKNTQSNSNEILLGQRQNTTKPFPHILRRGREKPSGLCHKKPSNLQP